MTRIVHAIVPRELCSLLAARQAAAAVEFAIIGMPLMMLVIGVMSFGYEYYLQFVLDYSLQQAVRQVQIGNVASTTTASAFITNTLCPIFSQFAPCTSLLVSVQPVSDYVASYDTITSTTQPSAFCTGQPGTLMFARASYQAPVWASFMTLVVPPSPSSYGQTIISAAAFANENPSGVTVAAIGGC